MTPNCLSFHLKLGIHLGDTNLRPCAEPKLSQVCRWAK
uniref:Uncharacterized protein n=1 Tax=Rhizophora mucronata TaxID=61149 RepID=A0A2P2NZZ0_RHIMU